MKKLIAAILLAITLTSFAEVSPKVKADIKTAALAKWGTNYSMVKYEIGKQTKAYMEVSNYLWSKNIPAKVRIEIAMSAIKKWGKNYAMVLYEINKQKTAYLSI